MPTGFSYAIVALPLAAVAVGKLCIRGIEMNLSAPKVTTFVASVVIVLLGILASLVSIPAISPYALWIIVLGFAVLAAGVLAEGI